MPPDYHLFIIICSYKCAEGYNCRLSVLAITRSANTRGAAGCLRQWTHEEFPHIWTCYPATPRGHGRTRPSEQQRSSHAPGAEIRTYCWASSLKMELLSVAWRENDVNRIQQGNSRAQGGGRFPRTDTGSKLRKHGLFFKVWKHHKYEMLYKACVKVFNKNILRVELTHLGALASAAILALRAFRIPNLFTVWKT